MRERLRLMAGAHDERASTVLVLIGAWVLTALLARLGIPGVDPTHLPVARPLETLGTFALCLPASLTAALLVDRCGWLTRTSADGPVRTRLLWLGLVLALTTPLVGGWLATLGAGVPAGHAWGTYVLLLGLAIASSTVVRGDLAIVLPLAVMVVATSGQLPFSANVIFNVETTGLLWTVATTVLLTAGCARCRWGDRRGRLEA